MVGWRRGAREGGRGRVGAEGQEGEEEDGRKGRGAAKKAEGGTCMARAETGEGVDQAGVQALPRQRQCL